MKSLNCAKYKEKCKNKTYHYSVKGVWVEVLVDTISSIARSAAQSHRLGTLCQLQLSLIGLEETDESAIIVVVMSSFASSK